jgi:hypothetical protein
MGGNGFLHGGQHRGRLRSGGASNLTDVQPLQVF